MPSRFPNLLEVSEREALARKRDYLDDVTQRLAEEIHQASCDKAEAAHREKWGL